MRAPTHAPVPVAVLGATGAVGQTFVRLLHGHPYFDVVQVGASERSRGRPYAEAVQWHEGELSQRVGALEVLACTPEDVTAPVVFSALDASVAGEVEESFARAGAVVLSNARNHRMDDDVPLVIPEINADHLSLVEAQRVARGWAGVIVTNANCAATTMALALAPLDQAFGVRSVIASTLQAVSGAGYPGVASMDIVGNVIPFISGEEPKIEVELTKLLGTLRDSRVEPASLTASVHANRVPVRHGHTACISVGLSGPVTPEEATEVLARWRGAAVCHGLPSAPDAPIVLRPENDRPQVMHDLMAGRGMSVVVGRVRPDPVLDLRLVALAHNTIRGAAGGSILNAEVMGRIGMLPDVEEGAW